MSSAERRNRTTESTESPVTVTEFEAFGPSGPCWFLGFGLNAATQLALQLHQERIQVVRSNKVVRGLPTESNALPPWTLDT